MSFENKRIVVTGVSSGVGSATAKRLMALGAEVIGIDVKECIGNCNQFLQCDLADPASIERTVAAINLPIHGLANVAGVPGSLPKEVVFKVNFLGLRMLTELLLPKIADNGAIVNVASTAGAGWRNRKETIKRILNASSWSNCLKVFDHLGLDSVATYDLTKEVVILYTMLISSQERHRGVRVNSISPGAVCTPILEAFYETMGDSLLGKLKRQAGGRDAYPDEVANALILFLREDTFWVNGTDLIVDGGAEVLMNLEEMAKAPISPVA